MQTLKQHMSHFIKSQDLYYYICYHILHSVFDGMDVTRRQEMKRKIIKNGVVFLILAVLITAYIAPNSIGMQVQKESKIFKQNLENGSRNIMVTGFWNPTGQMISQFSENNDLNPEGWKGENWEDLGFNIYSYFPTPGTYTGDFEVDYQDTWEDFWRITEEIKPVAIISFGAGAGPWEIEINTLNRYSWINDDESPYKPTPNPPDDTAPIDFIRKSTLPVENIEASVDKHTSIDAWIDWDGNPGAYLCGYIAYLGMWYQSLHNTTDGDYPCRAAGFIHVNAGVSVEDAKQAAEITIQETILYLKGLNLPPSIPTITGPITGNAGEEYYYSISSIEPDGDEVYYWVEWFDDCPGVSWDGPFDSGEEIIENHVWDEQGTYVISVKARDEFGAESDWATLEVSMPKNKQYINTPFLQFLENHLHMFPLLQQLLGLT